MRIDKTFTATMFALAGGAALTALGACTSPNVPRQMTQAEGRIQYPVQMAAWPRGISSAEEDAEMNECWAGSQMPPTRVDDQKFLECMGNKGFRLTIYRQNYVLSNVGQPLPGVSPPPTNFAAPYATPAPTLEPDQSAAPSTSGQFHLTRRQLVADGMDLGKAFLAGRKQCGNASNYNRCMARQIADGMKKDVLEDACSNQDAIRVQMTAWGVASQIPLFNQAAAIVCVL